MLGTANAAIIFLDMTVSAEELGFTPLPTYKQDVNLSQNRGSAEGVLSPRGISAWRHELTGVRVVRFSAPGPLVSLSIIVGTEPWSEAGHPHTLEHIVFLGSKQYPQRGYLDALACHSLGNGTNAFTCTEYTCFTANTIGYEGMLSLLPCYLDHVLRPTIDEAAFQSEVYHVRPDGKEAGVVFCEMRAREHTESDMMERELRRVLLKGSSLELEAGGLCDAIRTLTAEDIQRYHAENYCGANVCVLLGGCASYPTGPILESVASILQPVAKDPGFRKGEVPWQKQLKLTSLSKNNEKRMVRFPCVDEDIGTVAIGWRGAGFKETYRNLALDVLLRYLCNEPESPLKQQFVMTEDPLCSDIYYDIETYLHVSSFTLICTGVEHIEHESDEFALNDDSENSSEIENDSSNCSMASHDDTSDEKLQTSLLASGTVGATVMEFLAEIVQRRALPGGLQTVRSSVRQHREDFLSSLESDPHDTIPNSMIEELIYGDCTGILIGTDVRSELERLDDLQKESESFWVDLLHSALIDTPKVEIYMIPDSGLAAQNAETDEINVQSRLQAITDADCNDSQDPMKGTRAVSPCMNILSSSFPDMPSVEHIPRLAYSASCAVPGTYFADSLKVETDLIHTSVLFSTKCLSIEQRMFLPLLSELIFSLDLKLDDGTVISYVDSSREVSNVTVNTNRSGVMFNHLRQMRCDCFGIHYAATPDKFETATALIFRAIFHGHITNARVSSAAKNAHSELTEGLRDGFVVLDAAIDILPMLSSDATHVPKLTNAELTSLFGEERILAFVADEYSREKPRRRTRRKIVNLLSRTLRDLREQSPDNIYVHATARNPTDAHEVVDRVLARCWRPEELPGNAAHCDSSVIPIQNYMEPAIRRQPVPLLRELIPKSGLSRGIGIAGIESSFMEVRVDSFEVPGHGLWAPMSVMIQMLSRTEGPLYKAVRGAGLAYGVSLRQSLWQSRLRLSIDDSSAPWDAWVAVCRKMREFRKNIESENVSEHILAELDTAKNIALYELVEGRSTPTEISAASLACRALGTPIGELADRTLEEAVQEVDIASIRKTFDTYACKLLESDHRLAVFTCNSSVLKTAIKKFGCCCDPIFFETASTNELYVPEVDRVISVLERR